MENPNSRMSDIEWLRVRRSLYFTMLIGIELFLKTFNLIAAFIFVLDLWDLILFVLRKSTLQGTIIVIHEMKFIGKI